MKPRVLRSVASEDRSEYEDHPESIKEPSDEPDRLGQSPTSEPIDQETQSNTKSMRRDVEQVYGADATVPRARLVERPQNLVAAVAPV